MGLFGNFGFGGNLSHQSTSTKNSSGVDAYTQGQLHNINNAAQAAANGGPGANLTSAGDYATGLQNAGQIGTAAASGDPNAMAKLMNPYTSNVIDANNNLWNRINAGTVTTTNNAATAANAFGGSRAAVAQGAALSANNAQQAQQNASLLSSGYQNAVQQANQLAGMGYQGAQLNSQLGMNGVGNGLWQLNALKGGFVMPTGTYSDTEQHQTGYGVNGKVGSGTIV